MTDALKVIGENTAKSANGGYIKDRWIDIIEPKEMDTRTGAEIASDVIKKAGLKIISSA